MQNNLIITGLLGLLAAFLVGIGEYLLHYDALARFSEGGFGFMQGIGEQRTTLGHFFGVFGATLYPIGCYHIYLMLRSANEKAALATFFYWCIWIYRWRGVDRVAREYFSAYAIARHT
jgi:hypothetical protein